MKTQIFEKKTEFFPAKKRYWPNFSWKIECDRPQGTFYEGPQGILTIIVKVTGLIL